MGAKQQNATEFNPNGLALTCVATYEREIGAPLERVWENVLDWEHLPFLHSTSFGFVELDEAGDWGWRTWSSEGHADHIELVIADHSRYVARSYLAGNQVSEIWTTLTAADSRTGIRVDFHLANVKAENETPLGEAMLALYTRLWDEDEAMMMERHLRLHEQRDAVDSVDLGSVAELTARVAQGETLTFQLQRREFQLRLSNDQLIVHHTICPHLLGPLKDSDISGGELTCPWHGYRFDLDSGECVFPAHATCRLASRPELHVDAGRLIARAP